MKIEILGCGTSTGVPQPACNCDVCCSEHPRNTRLRTSALVTASNGAQILIDTSVDLRAQTLRSGIQKIDAVLFTHAHADHILGLDELRCFNMAQRQVIPCYGTAAVLAQLRQTFQHIFEPSGNYEGGLLAQLTTHEIREQDMLEIGGVTVQAFPLLHGRLRVTGYRFGPIGYATDCNAIPDESMAVLQGVRFLFLDGLRYEPHRTHFSIPQALEMAQKIGAERTYLIHTSHAVEYESVSARLPTGVELAYDGLVVEG